MICIGDARHLPIRAESVQCCVTSPPYFNLRDYQVAGQIGPEPTPEEYVAQIVAAFREVWRVLKPDGTLWLNIGDSYAACGGHTRQGQTSQRKGRANIDEQNNLPSRVPAGFKPKDLLGIPWMVAFALRADGWYLRSEIIWCLSGGTLVYVKTQKGEMPMTIKDMARLDPKTVKLWNGKKWTQLLGMNKSQRRGTEIELVLRSGERISCTPTHKFPTQRGLLNAGSIKPGDMLTSCYLPEPDLPSDCALNDDAAWFAGLYLAEGSRSGDTIQIAGHVKESARWDRVVRIAAKYGGTATKTETGNVQNIRVYGKILNAIVDEFVSGRTAINKGFSSKVWRYSNRFVAAMVDGYLSGDGHLDGDRWRLGFCRNYNLERDLRTACARLGYTLTLNRSSVEYNGSMRATFRGELRKQTSGHHNEKNRNEVVEVCKARCRHVWDIGVADEPHLFALASGVLTHNSKPNPMPESVLDRPTKAHEYMFLLTKQERYYYDADAVREPWARGEESPASAGKNGYNAGRPDGMSLRPRNRELTGNTGRNRRSVRTIPTQPCAEAHFAVMPEALVEPCILAGSRPGDVILDPFAGSGTVGRVAAKHLRQFIGTELKPGYATMAHRRQAGIQQSLLSLAEVEA